VRTAGDSWRPIARPWHWGTSSGTKRCRLRCAHASRSSCSTASRVLPSAPPLSYGRRAGARGCSSPLPRTHGRRVRQRHSPHAPVAHHQKRREAPAFMPGRDRRWARWAQCPRAQQDPRSTRALNGRGNCREGSPGIHAGEDVPVALFPERDNLTTRVRMAPALNRMNRVTLYASRRRVTSSINNLAIRFLSW